MNALKLYEIAPEFALLVDNDDPNDADLERLDELGHAIEVKASNIAALTDNMEMFIDLCKAEEKRISTKRKAIENRIKWVNSYLQGCMETAGVFEIEVGTRKIALQKNPPKVVIDSQDDIPPRFFTVIPESFSLDKNALKAELKKGEVKGAHLEAGMSLRKR